MALDTFLQPDPTCGRGPASVLRRVLIVDDSRLQRRILATSLHKWGFEVVEAESGAEAIEICLQQPPDLIFSDWVMPGMTGPEFCRALRALDLPNYVYFILLTSKSDKKEIAEGLKLGADDFLSKPVSAEELRARMTAGERILHMERELTAKNRLVNTTLSQLQKMHDVVRRDLAEARKLQLSLIPKQTKVDEKVQMSFLFQPSDLVGGDLVGMFPVSAGRAGFYSIDVSGHGIAAALITARLSARLRGDTPEQNVALDWDGDRVVIAPPELVCRRLNEFFLQNIESEHYATIAIADVHLETGRVRMCQAGHPHPLIQRRDGSVEFSGDGGLPIGLIADATYERVEARLQPGDRMFLYSDGLTECSRPDGTMLDDAGLVDILQRHAGAEGRGFLATLLDELKAFSRGDDFSDDVSGALLEYRCDV